MQEQAAKLALVVSVFKLDNSAMSVPRVAPPTAKRAVSAAPTAKADEWEEF